MEALLEARKGKNLTPQAAHDAVVNDVNMFGVMMVAMGDASGMVSGSIHTTAATIRPAMQVRRLATGWLGQQLPRLSLCPAAGVF